MRRPGALDPKPSYVRGGPERVKLTQWLPKTIVDELDGMACALTGIDRQGRIFTRSGLIESACEWYVERLKRKGWRP